MRAALSILIAWATTLPIFGQTLYTPAFYMPEFSGCISRPGLDDGYFWTCSDERREAGVSPTDAIWKVQCASGTVVATNPAVVPLNDMEAMAADANDGFFVLTSQSLATDMTFGSDSNRLRLAHYDATGGFQAVKSDLRGFLESRIPFLTNYSMMLPKYGGVDVEGMAYQAPSNRLWLGFRGPIVTNGGAAPGGLAVLLALTNVMSGSQFNSTTFGCDTNVLFFDLGGEGIRDLFYDADSANLFIVTGKMEGNEAFTDGQGNAFTNSQSCHLLAYTPATGARAYCMSFPQVPNMPSNATAMSEAEGICAIILDGVKRLLVTYDSKSNGVYQVFDFPSPTSFANPDGDESHFGL